MRSLFSFLVKPLPPLAIYQVGVGLSAISNCMARSANNGPVVRFATLPLLWHYCIQH